MKRGLLWIVVAILSLVIGLCVGYIVGKENRVAESSVVGTYKTDLWNGKSATLVIRADGTCHYPTGAAGTWVQDGTMITISLPDSGGIHTAEVVDGGILLHGHFFESVS